MAVATAAWILRSRVAPWLSLAMGVTLMSWIVVQVAMIGYVSWMQPTSFVGRRRGDRARGRRPAPCPRARDGRRCLSRP